MKEHKSENKNKIRQIAECGLLMATALAFSYFKLFRMPSGGSISLGFLPLLLIAARQGMKRGLLCGFLFGILLMANGATIMHPVQFLLDYPLAYMCAGFGAILIWNTGLKAATATTVASLIRLQFHVIAGAVFFGTKENFSEAIAFSYAYNCGHLIPETIICAAIVWYIASKHQNLCSQQNT